MPQTPISELTNESLGRDFINLISNSDFPPLTVDNNTTPPPPIDIDLRDNTGEQNKRKADEVSPGPSPEEKEAEKKTKIVNTPSTPESTTQKPHTKTKNKDKKHPKKNQDIIKNQKPLEKTETDIENPSTSKFNPPPESDLETILEQGNGDQEDQPPPPEIETKSSPNPTNMGNQSGQEKTPPTAIVDPKCIYNVLELDGSEDAKDIFDMMQLMVPELSTEMTHLRMLPYNFGSTTLLDFTKRTTVENAEQAKSVLKHFVAGIMIGLNYSIIDQSQRMETQQRSELNFAVQTSQSMRDLVQSLTEACSIQKTNFDATVSELKKEIESVRSLQKAYLRGEKPSKDYRIDDIQRELSDPSHKQKQDKNRDTNKTIKKHVNIQDSQPSGSEGMQSGGKPNQGSTTDLTTETKQTNPIKSQGPPRPISPDIIVNESHDTPSEVGDIPAYVLKKKAREFVEEFDYENFDGVNLDYKEAVKKYGTSIPAEGLLFEVRSMEYCVLFFWEEAEDGSSIRHHRFPKGQKIGSNDLIKYFFSLLNNVPDVYLLHHILFIQLCASYYHYIDKGFPAKQAAGVTCDIARVKEESSQKLAESAYEGMGGDEVDEAVFSIFVV